MSSQLTLWDTSNVTSLEAANFGLSPCDRLDGQTTAKFGQGVVPVRVFPQRAKDKGLQTLVTSGLIGHNSSASATLQQFLENRLVQRLDMGGSTLFKLTWKHKTTPLGRQYLERAASALRTSGKDFTSWPTPCAEQANGEPEAFLERKRRAVMRGVQMGVALTDLNMVAKLSSWRSPNARLNGGGDYSDPEKAAKRLEQGHQLNLSEEVLISAWPTPQTHDDKLRGNTEADHHFFPHDLSNAATLSSWPTPSATERSGQGPLNSSLMQDARLASWSTPRNEDAESAGMRHSRGTADTLTAQSSLAAWSSPSARDWKDTAEMATTGTNPDGSERSRLDQLPRQANLAGWPTPMAGSPATENYNEAGNNDSSRKTVELCGWASPKVNDDNLDRRGAEATKKEWNRENASRSSLPLEVKMLAAWPTPNCPNGGRVQSDEVTMTQRKTDGTKAQAALENVARLSGPVRLTAGGQVLTGSDAGMESSGQLDGAHSLWLQGIPEEWRNFVSQATQSVSLQRRHSSKRSSKSPRQNEANES